MTKHLVIHFARFGPYHFARLRSAADVLGPLGWRVSGLQAAGTDATYAWDQTGADPAGLLTIFPNRVYEDVSAGELRGGMMSMLDKLKPDAMAIAGWGTCDARAALDWCHGNAAKAIVMSETRASDGERSWWKEWLKGRLIRRFDGALVGGMAHKDYLVQLGMPSERILIGYDVVDNAHFAAKTAEVREAWRVTREEAGEQKSDVGAERSEPKIAPRQTDRSATTAAQRDRRVARSNRRLETGDLETESSSVVRWLPSAAPRAVSQTRLGNSVKPRPYFLVSSRFIERKNLRLLIDAYAEYRERGMERGAGSGESWNLVLLGSGDGREELEGYVKDKGIEGVFFAGFQQIDALPQWYAGAGAFVHPALEEPWGLVINEAMASGLPVICSRTTGAAELVQDGSSGFLFEPTDTCALADLLWRVAAMPEDARKSMGESARKLLEQKMPLSAFGKGLSQLIGAG